MSPTNSFPHVLWSQNPNLDGLDNRRKQYGHNSDTICFLLWARLGIIDITFAVDWCHPKHPSYCLFSVCGIDLLICASPKIPGFHGNSGVLLGSSWNIVFWTMNSESEFSLWTFTSCWGCSAGSAQALERSLWGSYSIAYLSENTWD